MNEQEILCFLAAIKYLSFTEAANHMYLSQSAFSRCIARLEKELGISLFYRDTKSVEPTAAGYYLAQQFGALYEESRRHIEKARLLDSGISGLLKIGLLSGQAMDPRLQTALKDFSEESPDVHIELSRHNYLELTQALSQEKLDGILTLALEVKGNEEVCVLPISVVKTLLVLPAPHPLAGKDRISAEDIRTETFLAPSEMSNQETHKMVFEVFSRYGFDLKIEFVKSIEDQLLRLEAGLGIALLNEQNLTCHSPALVCKEQDFFPDSEIVFVYNKKNKNMSLLRFTTYLK